MGPIRCRSSSRAIEWSDITASSSDMEEGWKPKRCFLGWRLNRSLCPSVAVGAKKTRQIKQASQANCPCGQKQLAETALEEQPKAQQGAEIGNDSSKRQPKTVFIRRIHLSEPEQRQASWHILKEPGDGRESCQLYEAARQGQ